MPAKEKPQIFVKKTSSKTIIDDYAKLMELANYTKFFSPEQKTLVKLNLSWSKYYPACSSPPWQVEGVLKKMKDDGFSGKNIFTCENRTVVTNIAKGLKGNKWSPIITKYNTYFVPLTRVKFTPFKSKLPLMVLDSKIFPEGFSIPQFYIGKNMIHLPTFKTHGHTGSMGGDFDHHNHESAGGITCSIKNSFGGLLTKRRHFSHQYMSEVLVDLLTIQKQIHPSLMAIVDGTVAGDGAGPRCMMPRIKNYIMAGYDQVAVDAIAAKMMGFDPMKLPFIKLCHDAGLGCGDPDQIEIIGDEDAKDEDWKFSVERSLVVWGDQQVRKGKLKFLEPLMHTFLFNLGPVMLSAIYHDLFWYNTIGKQRIKKYNTTEWGRLFKQYPSVIPNGQRLNLIRPE
ncbi:hypothetical protein NEF87_003591 [Candidatus Lokiarchaeum ossiferum]|uniref:DUF362 domain-containing protein n=1 Tax=Candidatus Lokiarchaeum ossiferum TaxID=2951803 RepID=A0ABY6HUW8_9ARCH|nr:hypothetical protein NEF87_003591 [Candidatus Lokiarchaeum sp. B-35]